MLCTECSNEVRPVVAVDIDGTLGDFHTHFCNFAETYLGRQLRRDYLGIGGTGSFRTWACALWGINDGTWYDIKLAYRQGAQKRSMPIFSGAQYLCKSIREAGAELWLTTTRPYLRLDNIDPDTRAWLHRYSIEYDGLLYDEGKYERLAEIVDPKRVVAVLDDLPEQWQDAAAIFGWRVPILRKTQWNSGVRCEQAVFDLYNARNEITKRIDDWKEKHGGNGRLRTESTSGTRS